MKKALFTLLAMFFLLAWYAPTEAATVKVKVLEANTNLALKSYCYMTAYKKTADGWDYIGRAYVYPPETQMTYENLEAGTYYFVFAADNYLTQYYKNKTNFDKKAEVTLTASQTMQLAAVYLKPNPIQLEIPILVPPQVPSTGGQVIAWFDVVNDSAQAKRLRVWPNITVNAVLYGATQFYLPFDMPSKVIEVPAGSRKTAKFVINVPADAPAEPAYFNVIYFAAEENKWTPVAVPLSAGSFSKAAQ